MADAAYSRRDFAGGAVVTTITGSINSSDTSITIASSTGWPSGTNGEFFVVINKGQSTEEKVRVDTRSGSTLTVTSSGRGVDGTTAASHAAGESIQVCATAFDLDEANKAVAELVKKATAAGQVPVVSGANEYTMVASGTSGRILVGNGTTVASVAVSGDATLAASGALTIANDAVTAAKIATDAVGSSEIAADAVGSAEIAAGAVGSSELASDAVTTAKILDANVTTGKIADSAITSAKIADGTIVAADLAEAVRPRWTLTGWTGRVEEASIPLTSSFTSGIADYGLAPGVPTRLVMTEAGSIIGVSVSLTAARTAGSLVCEVYKNGSATGLTVTIDGTHTQYWYGAQAAGADTFVAGDTISIAVAATSFDVAGSTGFGYAVAVHCQVT